MLMTVKSLFQHHQNSRGQDTDSDILQWYSAY